MNRTILTIALIVVAIILIFILFGPAAHARWGGPCKQGQILRVHLGKCVPIRSAAAAGYAHVTPHVFVRRHPAPRHHRSRHWCDPVTQCGDPVEDRVDDDAVEQEVPTSSVPKDPPQTGGTTPRDLPTLPDPFGRSTLRRPTAPLWKVQ